MKLIKFFFLVNQLHLCSDMDPLRPCTLTVHVVEGALFITVSCLHL